jgi:hypothetical protein
MSRPKAASLLPSHNRSPCSQDVAPFEHFGAMNGFLLNFFFNLSERRRSRLGRQDDPDCAAVRQGDV